MTILETDADGVPTKIMIAGLIFARSVSTPQQRAA